jgi:hypothetical protein
VPKFFHERRWAASIAADGMIRAKEKADGESETDEPEGGRPAASGEAWLGRNRTDKRRLWDKLNPRHRKELRMLAEALALQQTQARLSEVERTKLAAALVELDRVVRRVTAILGEIARRR